jgi:hypothetical protein
VSTSSTSGYTEKLILFKGEVAISSNNLWLPRNGSQVPSGLSAAAIVNGEEYSVGTGGYYVELPDGVLTELYIQATSGISGNTKFYPTIRYKDDPTYTSSYPPAPTNNMLWNQIVNNNNALWDAQRLYGAENLIPYPYYNTSKVENGVTFTDNGDGTITVSTGSGGATSGASFTMVPYYRESVGINPVIHTDKPLFLSGCPAGGKTGNTVNYYLQCALSRGSEDWSGGGTDYGEGARIIPVSGEDHYSIYVVRIIINAGTILTTPITFEPMLALESDARAKEFVPYAKINYELTKDVLKLYDRSYLNFGGFTGSTVKDALKGMIDAVCNSNMETGVTYNVKFTWTNVVVFYGIAIKSSASIAYMTLFPENFWNTSNPALPKTYYVKRNGTNYYYGATDITQL